MTKGVSKIVILGFIFILIVLITGGFYLIVKKAGKNVALPVSPKDERTVKPLSVTAKNGKFKPSDFETELFSDVDLTVEAVDKDYTFSVLGFPRLDTVIKKGETKKIQLYSLGVGEYRYSCGEGCGGKIIVSQETDIEEGAED